MLAVAYLAGGQENASPSIREGGTIAIRQERYER
jgi:hypothetical protein